MYRKPCNLLKDLYFSDSFERGIIISDEIRKVGYRPKLQRFNYQNSNGNNITVEFKGTINYTVIISAHYDGNGAYDNIGGVYMLLSLIKYIKNIKPFYSYRFVFFDKEEDGQIGSKLFLENYDKLFGKGSLTRIIQHIAIDGCGIGEKFVYINNLNEITFLIDKKKLTIQLLADFRSFRLYGIPSLHTFSLPEKEAKGLIYDMKFPDTWLILHSDDDNLNNIRMKYFDAFQLSIMKALDMISNTKLRVFKQGIATFDYNEDNYGY